MNKVSIIGYGRFGAMLHALLSKGFEVDVYDKKRVNNSDVNEVSLAKALQNETIFIAVPIRDFESLIHEVKNDIQGKKNRYRCLLCKSVSKECYDRKPIF
jgi:prephenate dehydrogenase